MCFFVQTFFPQAKFDTFIIDANFYFHCRSFSRGFLSKGTTSGHLDHIFEKAKNFPTDLEDPRAEQS